MCEPVTIAMTVASVALSIMQAQEQNKAVNKQVASNNNIATIQQQQDNARAASEQAKRATQGAVEQGAIRAAASESGFFGNSTDSLFHESQFNEGTDITSIEKNRSNHSDQVQREKEAGILKGQSQKTSDLAIVGRAGLQIGGAYADYTKSQKAVGK